MIENEKGRGAIEKEDWKSYRLPLESFINGGYLHEINRIIMHPLGLRLAVYIKDEEVLKGRIVESDRREFMCSIEICHELGGFVFPENKKDEVLEKKNRIESVKDLLRKRRIGAHGFEIQWEDE